MKSYQELATRVRELEAERDRVREALAWLADGLDRGIYRHQIRFAGDGSFCYVAHNGTPADIERALLEAVDAARRASR